MRRIKQLLIAFLMLTIPSVLFAQEKESGFGEMMRSNGRIYVVVAVMLTILAGLILYLVRIDRKIKKLENNNH